MLGVVNKAIEAFVCQRYGDKLWADLLIDLSLPGYEYDGTPCQISASLGVLVHVGGTPWEASDVLHRVDEAVYASKHGGRGQANFAA